jgi:UDP-glucuronate 4-epimerase
MQKILITGGAGFIGSHCTRALLMKNMHVVCLDNFNDFYDPSIKHMNILEFIDHPNYRCVEGDIRDAQLMDQIFQQHHFDAVIHLAAMAGVRPSIENPLLYEDVNIKGFQIVLETMRKFDVKKLVAASSSSVYGNNDKVPFSETDNVDYAISPYAATKKSNEVMAHVYHRLYHLDVILLRFFTVYGPGQRPDLAIHKFTKMIDEGKAIPFFGDGSTRRDYTYIQDIVEGVLASLTYVNEHLACYEIINLGEATPIDLSTMVRTIENALGKKAVINHLPMQAGDVNVTYADIEKARRLLHYQPHTAFEEGIKAFVKWYREVNG